MKTVCLFLPIALFAVASLATAEVDQYPRPELLMEPTGLAKPDVAKQFIVLDARPAKDYKAERIPGARWVDHDAWAKAFGDGQDTEGWSQRIGELGIGANSKVVIYDDKGMKDAARIWWVLRYWGLDDVRLLDGGWKTWKAQSLPTEEQGPAAVSKVEFTAKPRAARLANKSQVLDWLKAGGVQVVDARSNKEFCGLDKQENKRAGAIPGAKHLEWSDLVDQKTHRFKSPGELRRLMAAAGIDLARPTVSHCQQGGRASVMAFGLELMGANDVRNYYLGWSEWGNVADTPVVASAAKPPAALNFTVKSLDGKDVDLDKYRGKVVLIVNVASKCGLTPQYKKLQALHEKHAKDGLAILAFPCNQFGHQEPGTPEEIQAFCRTRYGVSFDLFAKVEVNGEGACALYKHLTALDTKPAGPGKISWNFEKFLLGRNGEVVARFAPRTKPDDAELLKMIEAELKKN